MRKHKSATLKNLTVPIVNWGLKKISFKAWRQINLDSFFQFIRRRDNLINNDATILHTWPYRVLFNAVCAHIGKEQTRDVFLRIGNRIGNGEHV